MADLALMVGINRYPTCPLDGCDDDAVDAINTVVEKRNFDKQGIQLITDERATTPAILAGLDRLVTKARPKDRVLFWFSGHTAQVPADINSGEEDGLNEVLCPVEFDYDPKNMITDKQLHAIFARFAPEVHFNWISDSCHSAGLTRDFSRAPVHKVRGFPVPSDIAWHVQLAKERGFTSREIPQEINVGFLSACREDQVAADALFNMRPNGALSYYFLQVIREVDVATPLAVIRELVLQRLIAAHYIQEPQVLGPLAGASFL